MIEKINVIIENEEFLPKYETSGASGMDVRAWKYSLPEDLKTINKFTDDGFELQPHERILIKTGIKADIPKNHEIQMRPRSGLTLKHGIVAQFGTLDEDYKGDFGVILLNTSNKPFRINKGERYGQIVLAEIKKVEWKLVDQLGDSSRGEGGFNSTGLK